MIGVTIWHADGMTVALDKGAEVMLCERQPALVNLHSWPRPALAPIAERVRKACPNAKLWVSPGVNGLADDEPHAVEKQARDWRKYALDLGAELVLVNAEGAAKEGLPGWKYSNEGRSALADRAKAMLNGLAGSSLRIGFTSHDCPEYHRIDWQVWLGPDSPVTTHAPQVYPGVKGLAALPAVQNRWQMATTQWRRLVKRGIVRPELGPDGSGWCTYTQGWGAQPIGTAWLLNQRDAGLVWAAPSRLTETGAKALDWTLRVRREAGDSAGAIERWQAAHGLVADGLIGAKSEAALQSLSSST